jgi:hypothetical protein
VPPSIQKEKPRNWSWARNQFPGDVLLSHEVYLEVPSGLKGLTAVFGMGTGVAPSLRSPGKLFTVFSGQFSVVSIALARFSRTEN